jgi:Domain of unknown function (DUF4388)
MARHPSAMVPGELGLTPEQRARLGLEDGESVRVLTASPRTFLLERVQDGAGEPLPFDRELVLSAEVRAFALADLLQLIHAQVKSGFLRFEHSACTKTVYLHAGEVVFATSNQRVDRLGEYLVRTGAISQEQQDEAGRAYRPPAPFGRFLVKLGFLSPRDLWFGVKGQVEEIVRSLFAFELGSVLFWEGEVRPDNVVRLALPTERLIAEGLEQRDDLLRFLALLESPRVELEPVEGAAAQLAGTERALLQALDSVTGFGAMCRRVGLDPLSGARTVRLLDAMGALRIVSGETTEVERLQLDERSAREDDLRACVRAHVKLLAELAAPIVAMEGAESLQRRISQVLQEAAVRHPEMLAGLDVGAGGAIDPDALIRRALRFPGDRERTVRSALGELISYLEFELFNHPQIEDAEDFLEAMEALRSRL